MPVVAPKEWIIAWFERESSADPDALRAGTLDNYLERGWIDSFTFVKLIDAIETAYAIRFSADQFQDRAFATIDGLSAVIDRYLHERTT